MSSRREFIATCCAVSLAACSPSKMSSVKVGIGEISSFSEGTNVLDFYRLVVRKRSEQGAAYFSAMSKLCTHQSCLLNFEASAYICPCHGSQFSEVGTLIKGPALVGLPYYKLYYENQRLYVDFSEQVASSWEVPCLVGKV